MWISKIAQIQQWLKLESIDFLQGLLEGLVCHEFHQNHLSGFQTNVNECIYLNIFQNFIRMDLNCSLTNKCLWHYILV